MCNIITVAYRYLLGGMLLVGKNVFPNRPLAGEMSPVLYFASAPGAAEYGRPPPPRSKC